jgi:hypothetical protein
MHRGVMTLDASFYWILTATPMMNRVSDYLGYLMIFWKERWDHDVYGDSIVRSYEPEYWKQIGTTYTHWVANTPLYVLNPRTFARLANRGVLTGQVARHVLQAILQCLQMRRTKASYITVGGERTRIGDTIPPYEIVTVELKMSPGQQRLYDHMYAFYANQLARQKGGDDDDDGDVPKPDKKAPEPLVITDVGIRNNGMHRRLCLMTLDPHLEVFCSRARGHSMSKDVQAYMNTCADNGMTTLFALCCPEIGMLPPIDRFSLGDWMALQSPKLQYICLYMHDVLFARPYVSDTGELLAHPLPSAPAPTDGTAASTAVQKGSTTMRRRVLFFTQWPAVLWEVYGFLCNLGLNVAILRPGMEAGDLRDAIADFNDPDSSVDVLVAALHFATGLNLHKCCCEMLIIEVSLSSAAVKRPCHLQLLSTLVICSC